MVPPCTGSRGSPSSPSTSSSPSHLNFSSMSSSKHSVKVPRLYKSCARLLRLYDAGQGNVRTLVYDNTKRKHPNVKAVYSLLSECVRNREKLKSMIVQSNLMEMNPKLDPYLAQILLTELLVGKKKVLPGKSRPEQTINNVFANVTFHKDESIGRKPRWVRINNLKVNIDNQRSELDVYKDFQLVQGNDDNNEEKDENEDYNAFIDQIRSLNKDEFINRDFHLGRNLLIFGVDTDLHLHPDILEGRLVLQDKASCLPVTSLMHDLNVNEQFTVMDCCAAPGMKTTQIAAFPNISKVIAVERDNKRCRKLRETIDKLGAREKVEVINQDFLQVRPENHEKIDLILLDPSCSGSGMPDRAKVESEDRLRRLSSLQLRLLNHAATFKGVRRISYSTCSLSYEENEAVVESFLKENNDSFHLIEAMPNWSRRGQGSLGKMCIRAEPHSDLCHGFFVALFERSDFNQSNNENDFRPKSKKKKIK